MHLIRLFILLFISINPILLFAQDSAESISSPAPKARITGYLVFADKKPVQYAVVYIPDLEKYSMSNEDGRFEIPDVLFGKYTLEVKTIEAAPKKIDIEVNKRLLELSVTLDASRSHDLSEVVVWGKNETRRLKEKGFAVNVVETQKAAAQSIQATELLDRTAGVRIRQSGGLGSQAIYNINGLAGNSVRIFIDGIPVRNFGSSFSLNSIPPAQLERIEVYKGIVPAYLSEDALGGAINVVLKRPRKNLSASYSFGSFNTHRANIEGGFRNKKSGFTVDVSAFYNFTNNNYKVWGDQIYVYGPPTWKKQHIKTKRFHDDYESYGINGNIGFSSIKWADLFTLGFLYSDMNKDVQHGGTMEIVFGNRRTGQDTKMANLKYEKRDLGIKNLDLTTFVSYTHSNRWVVDTIPYIFNWSGGSNWDEANNDYYKWSNTGEQGQATLAENKEKTIAGRANLSYALGERHKLSVNYFVNNFIRDVEDPLLPKAEQELTETRYLTKQIIGFTYENHFFKERLRTSLFFKHYIQSVKLKDPVKNGNSLSSFEYDASIDHNGYGVTASYTIFSKLLLMASYEKALRLPESNELLGNTSESIDATYDLKPERSNNFNLGFLIGSFNFGQHELKADINTFIRDVRDKIMRQAENTKTGTYGYDNLGKVFSSGFDFEIGYNYKKRLFITYNLSRFDARYKLKYDESGTKIAYYNDRLRNAPYFTMNANAEYMFRNVFLKGSRLILNYNFAYVHEFYKNWESIGGEGKAVIPTQRVNDIAIIYSFPKNRISVSFDAKNLFNEQVFDNWALQKPGRAFYGKITYKLF